MKKYDKIIICILIIFSFIPYVFLRFFVNDGVGEKIAYINVDGKFYKSIPLTGQIEYKEISIKTNHGYNKLAIENESIGVIETDCRDRICEEFGFISKPGETITCLPHKLYIEIKGKKDEDIDIRIY